MSELREIKDKMQRIYAQLTTLDAEISALPQRGYRDGESWTDFEKDTLYDRLLLAVDDLSTKFGRTHNAIWWAMSRIAREKRK